MSFCCSVTTSGPLEPSFSTGRVAGLIVVVVVAGEPFLVVAVAGVVVVPAAAAAGVVPGTRVVPVACWVLTDLTPPSEPSLGTTASRITVASTASPITTIPREVELRCVQGRKPRDCAASCAARRRDRAGARDSGHATAIAVAARDRRGATTTNCR